MQAYKLVEKNAGAAGIDKESITEFSKNLKDNLYKLWNRMSSGSYFPQAVKAVAIPKKQGGERILGVPTVSDRVAQMVVKLMLEPLLEPKFHKDSYGYRPNKSALDAVGITRQRCWRYDWVLEYDIKGAFDNLDHELLMKALKHHTKDKMIILYVERWLKAPLAKDGTLIERTKGVPQGSVIGPLLMNLFMHYAFDMWMDRVYPQNPFARYADDGVIHCRNEEEAERLKDALVVRFKECGLELHPDKTMITYCKDTNRKGKYSKESFDFLGYTFRPRGSMNKKQNKMFVEFSPGVSRKAIGAMRAKTRESRVSTRVELSLEEIAKMFNPIIQGWINYYGKYKRYALYPVLKHFNATLVKWAMHKYKKQNGHRIRAYNWLKKVTRDNPRLFVHWRMMKFA